MGKLAINDNFQQQTVCLPEGTSTSRQPTQPSIGPIPLLGWDRTEPTHASGKRFMNPPQKKTNKYITPQKDIFKKNSTTPSPKKNEKKTCIRI